MKSRFEKWVVRIKLAIRQNRVALAFVLAWLLANAFFFARSLGMKPLAAALVAACITKMPGGYTGAYQTFTEVVVFGVLASVVLTNVTRKYRPEETSRELAKQASNHIVIIGFTNLGKRVWDLAANAGTLAVVIEPNAELVETLVRNEDPVVIGSPSDRAVIEAAAVKSAKVVIIATDDLEHAAIACRLVRELNADCELVVRCPDDDVGALLARTYRARALSTSRVAAELIQAHAVKLRAKAVLVLGTNNVAQRTIEALEAKRIPHAQAPATSDLEALTKAGVPQADLVVLCDDDLGDNLIRVDRIRDLNKRTRIICRAFEEDAAEILTRAPFECVVLSSSRQAIDSLARAGVFRGVGIDSPMETRTRRQLATATA